ncbi:MAG: hypothetical protein MZU97_13195 [Bacillus subtilis]|nr:hypothetical protein [Bacillus subtilis]
MPQTRFVLQEGARSSASSRSWSINKVDRPDARPTEVRRRGASTCSSSSTPTTTSSTSRSSTPRRQAGYAELRARIRQPDDDLQPLFDTIVEHVAAAGASTPPARSSFSVAMPRLQRLRRPHRASARSSTGTVKTDQTRRLRPRSTARSRSPASASCYGVPTASKRIEIEEADAGDIVAIAGLAGRLRSARPSATIGLDAPLPPHPDRRADRVQMIVRRRTTSPARRHRKGKFVTAARSAIACYRETAGNVALRFERLGAGDADGASPAAASCSSRILIENMRREGFELQVSRPRSSSARTSTASSCSSRSRSWSDRRARRRTVGVVMQKLGERKGELDRDR